MEVANIKVQRGFSLVEMLVATTILLLVLFIGSYAHSMYSRYWHKDVGKFNEKYQMVKEINALHKILKSMRPYVVKGGDKGAYFYFEGGKTLIRMFVAQSISEPELPAFVEIKAVVNEDETVDIQYSEQVLKNKPVFSEADITGYGNAITLVSNVEQLSFQYYGFGNYEQWVSREQENALVEPTWFGFYSGKDTQITPSLIQLNFTIDGKGGELLIPLSHFSREQLEFYMTSNVGE